MVNCHLLIENRKWFKIMSSMFYRIPKNDVILSADFHDNELKQTDSVIVKTSGTLVITIQNQF